MQKRLWARGGLVAFIIAGVLAVLVSTTLRASAQSAHVTYGETVEGEIANAGDTNSWVFDGLRGDVVTVQVTRISGNIVPTLTLTDSEKTILIDLNWPQDGPSDVQFTVTLRTSGTHTLVVRGSNDTTGSYTLSPELLQAGENPIREDLLIYGRAVSGEITDSSFRQVWSFRGAQNDVIDISMTTTSGDLDGYLTLLTPENNVVTSADSGGEAAQDPALYAIKLPSAGVYTLVARRAGANSGESGTTQGSYDLVINLRAAGSTETNVIPTELILGSSTRGRLSIDAPRALFSADASGILALALDLADPSQVGTLSLFTPEHAVLKVVSGISPLRASLAVTQPGSILIEVSVDGLNADTMADFALTATTLTTATHTARALQYNQARVISGGTIQSDTWYFGGRAGDLIDISVKPYDPILDGGLRVFAPSGTRLASIPVQNDTKLPLVLAETGQYEVFVDGVNTTYEIDVERRGMSGLAFSQRLIPDSRGVLLPGSANAVSGELSPGGSEAWGVDITTPQTWSFELSQTGSDAPAALAVEAPDGEQLALAISDRISNSAILQIPIPQPGRYRVVVFDPTDSMSHAYTLRGQPSEGGPLQPGVPVKGVLTDDQPYDKWQIHVKAGATADVELEPLIVGSLPVVNVFGADGQLLASSKWTESADRIKLANILAIEGGTFQIVVVQSPGTGRFVYHLTADVRVPFDETALKSASTETVGTEVFVTKPTPAAATDGRVSLSELISTPVTSDNAHPLALETLGRGEVTSDERSEAWSFSADAGQMLEFYVIAVNDASDPRLVLLDQQGTVLAENAQQNTKTNTLSYRFSASGTYILAVELGREGHYTLWIQSLPNIDEHAPTVIPGQAIAYGMMAEGEIIQTDDAPLYVFEGRAGDVIAAAVRGISGDLRPGIALATVNGDELITTPPASDPAVAELSEYSLPDDALYELRVDHDGATTGRYALHLDLESLAASGAPSGGLLDGPQIGALGAGNAPTQRWLFTGHSGERVTVRATLLSSGSPTPFVLQLADSAGAVFAQREAQLGRGALAADDVLLPRTGIYQAIVSGGQREVGFYQISLGRDPSGIPSRERAIRYGQTLGHVLTQENFLDVWTFAGSKGDMVTIAARPVRGDEAPINMQLRSQDGQVVLTAAPANAATGVRAEHVTLPQDGHYSILIGNLDTQFNGETAYELTVQLEKTEAHSVGTVISYGQPASGTFYIDDATDTWLFEGQQGDEVAITAAGLYPGLMPSLSLISTDWRAASQYGQAAVLATAQAVDEESAQITLALPYDGPYAVMISDPLLVGGNYQLSITARERSPMVSNPVHPDQTRTGQIGASDFVDAWTFSGNTNDVVSITVKPESRSSLAPEIKLLAPDGTLLVQADASSGTAAQINAYTLPFVGQYAITVSRVFGGNGHTGGRYALDLRQTAADRAAIQLTAYGRLERDSLDSTNPVDQWAFDGKRGDTVHLHVEATSGDLDPVLRLYDVNGQLLSSADDGQALNPELLASIPADGTYVVDVTRYHGLSGTTKGNYALGIDLAYQAGVLESGRWLVYGDRVSGSTDARNPNAVWMFAGEQGDLVSAKIQFPLDDVPLTLTLRDPAGNTLATGERDRGDAVIQVFTLPSRGDYVLEVHRPDDARALHSPYTVEISLLGAAITGPQAGGTLVIGQSVTGAFITASETHSWVFEGKTGDSLSIRLNALNSLYVPKLDLLAPDGALLASLNESGSLSPSDAVVLPIDGIYTLLVTGDIASVGTIYRLSLRKIESDHLPTPTITPLQDAFGTINAVRPEEIWRFDSQAGEAIYARLEGLSGDLAPTLMLWGPDNRPLAEGVREYTVSGTQVYLSLPAAPSTGKYQIIVGRDGGAAGSTFGGYSLMLRTRPITAKAASATDVAFDQPVSGFLDGANPRYYAFQGLAGEIVALAARSGSAELALSLEIEDGTPLDTPGLITGVETGIPAFVLPDSGRYIVTLTSEDAADYMFVATRQPRDLPSGEPTRELEIDRSFIGDITDATRLTYWTFSGGAGDVLNFNVDTTGGALRTSITLYGPRGYVGNVVQQRDSSMATLGPIRLPDDGEYHVVIGAWPGFTGDPVGRYVVQVERAEAGVSGSPGGTLVVGQFVTGGLIREDAQDTWMFAGQAGEVVDVFAEQTRGDDSLAMQLLAPDGRMLAASEPGTTYLGAEIRTVRLPETGTYQIAIIGELNSADGVSIEYRLSITRSQTSVLASMSAAQGIMYGQERAGVLSAGSNPQAWVFFGHAGDRINVQVSPLSAGVAPVFYLLRPDGTILRAETGLIAGAPIAMSGVVLPEDGFFGLVVGGRLEDTPGANGRYSITLDQLAAGAQYQGVLTDRAAARLTPGASIHEWQLSPEYSGDYAIQITASSGILPELSVMSENGIHGVGRRDEHGNVVAVIHLEAHESYSVVVSGGPAIPVLIPYEIAVMPASAISGGGDLLSGESNIGRINADFAANEWRVIGGVGQLTVEVQSISGGLSPSAFVFDTEGTLIADAGADENGHLNIVAETPSGGSYKVVVSGTDAHIEGDYVITVTAG